MLRPNNVLTTLAIALLLTTVTPATPGAAVSQPQLAPGSTLEPDDWDAPVVADNRGADTTQGLFDEDPTGLVPKTPFVQRYSLDQDHWEVWLCGSVTHTMPQVLAALEAATVDYYDSLSGGVYEPIFTAGGTKPPDATCLDEFLNGYLQPGGKPGGIAGHRLGYRRGICVAGDDLHLERPGLWLDRLDVPQQLPLCRRRGGLGNELAVGDCPRAGSYPAVATLELGHRGRV